MYKRQEQLSASLINPKGPSHGSGTLGMGDLLPVRILFMSMNFQELIRSGYPSPMRRDVLTSENMGLSPFSIQKSSSRMSSHQTPMESMMIFRSGIQEKRTMHSSSRTDGEEPSLKPMDQPQHGMEGLETIRLLKGSISTCSKLARRSIRGM